MCGLVYAHNIGGMPVNNDVLNQFDKQRSRGVEGFGYFDGKTKHLYKRASENAVLKYLVKYESNLIMFHHRRPTSTINVKRAAHPFRTGKQFGDTEYVLIHNGHVSNARDIQKKHAEDGITYQSILEDGTFNDSEALLWDFALTKEGKQDELKVYGGIAFICIELHKGELVKLHFARNNNPLNLLRDKDGIKLSSEGEGEAINPRTLYSYNYKLNRLTKKDFEVPSYQYTNYGNGGGYKPFEYTPSRLPASTDSWYDNIQRNWERDASYKKSRSYLSRELHDRYDDYLDELDFEEAKELYEYDGDSGFYVPRDSLMDELGSEPTVAQIEVRVASYLIAANGHFEQAYWAMESDYYELLDDSVSAETATALKLIEACFEELCNDDEYINDKSVSSIMEYLNA